MNTRRVNCTRCFIFFKSASVYREDELTAVAGTRARLCDNCTQKLIASGHIKRCNSCWEMHSRGHDTPTCPWFLPLAKLSLWAYSDAPAGTHGRYVELWRRCKAARATEMELESAARGEGKSFTPKTYEFGYGNFMTLAQWLRDTRKALHTRINLKAGVQTDYLGRKVIKGTPRRLLGRRPRLEGCGRFFRDEGRERSGNCGNSILRANNTTQPILCGTCEA